MWLSSVWKTCFGCKVKPAPVQETCWICMDDTRKEKLIKPCSCPRYVHATCIAKWQFQKRNTYEESFCRFCHKLLRPWSLVLKDRVYEACVILNGSTTGNIAIHQSSPDRTSLLTEELSRLIGIDINHMAVTVSFVCLNKGGVDSIIFNGIDSYHKACSNDMTILFVLLKTACFGSHMYDMW